MESLHLVRIFIIQLFILHSAFGHGKKLDAKIHLHLPSLEDLAKTLQNGLEENFKTVRVSVVECPNLTQKPFCLAAKGLGGSPRIADIGSPGYLYPIPQKDKLYNIREVCNTSDLPNAFVLGSGPGPFQLLGYNSEMVHNDDLGNSNFQSYSIRYKNSSYSVKILDNETLNEFALMANLILTEGKTDKVLKIIAKKRIGKQNFPNSIRLALGKKYGSSPVGFGGTFAIKSGTAKLHLMGEMPEKFSSLNELTDTWFKYFDVDSPLVCTSVFVSHDPGLDLRTEHTHCFSCDQKHGGHYLNDTTADEIEYEGYFTPAELLYRIDRPLVNTFPL